MEYFLKYLFHSILYDLAVDDLFAAYRRRTTPPLFQGGKSEFLLGRDAAPSPHVTFERTKVTKTLSEGFRSPQTPANGSCRELFKYKLLSTDFYVGTGQK